MPDDAVDFEVLKVAFPELSINTVRSWARRGKIRSWRPGKRTFYSLSEVSNVYVR